jgi:hypothetical protein
MNEAELTRIGRLIEGLARDIGGLRADMRKLLDQLDRIDLDLKETLAAVRAARAALREGDTAGRAEGRLH